MKSIETQMQDELEGLKASHLFRTLKKVDSEQSSRIVIDGRECINLSSNNYLGLANHQALKEASTTAINKYGNSAAASRLISGNMDLHEILEMTTASFKGTEDALLFNSGYTANIGILQALADERDAIFSDELNHASIIDGCRLSRARVFIYNHRDAGHLRSLLSSSAEKGGARYRRRVVVTDSVFSMDGDIAPIPDIIDAAEEYDAMLIADDAHATGVLGKGGRGAFEHFGIKNGRCIQMGTYSKALGSFGAYIACNRTVKEYLINNARSFIYTTALPPSVIAASIAAIKLLQKDTETPMSQRLTKGDENPSLLRLLSGQALPSPLRGEGKGEGGFSGEPSCPFGAQRNMIIPPPLNPLPQGEGRYERLTIIPPHQLEKTGGGEACPELVEGGEGERRGFSGEILNRLRENTKLFRDGLKSLGYNTLNSETPIIPLFLGDTEKTILFSKRLFDEGIYASAIRPPTVPAGACRIRTTVSAIHSREDIEYCIEVFRRVGIEIGII
ncbi:MAG: pyridoxal phosphate-dependent aminotransferase family protein [Nitrospirae bacterium]|nr:pyridoxal phosphate-dependent aminotransferase family protein [Nitrospirota bacterium]